MALPAPVNQPLLVNDTRSIHPIWLKWFTQTQSSAVAGITSLTGAVTATGPGAASVTIVPLAVTTSTLANDAVTYAKMQNVTAASRVLGRGSAGGAGDVEEIALGTGLLMSGTTLSASTINTVGYWSPLTNGDPVTPELIFDGSGDSIAVWTVT